VDLSPKPTTLVPLAALSIEREGRQRRELRIESLMDSIARNGVLVPIIVHYDIESDSLRLVAGERRVATCQALDLEGRARVHPPGLIPAVYTSDLSPTELQIIELEENIKRLDLPWQDIVRGVGKIHGLYRARDPQWTISQTGDAISLSQPTVSIYMTVFEFMGDERVATSGTVREAYNLLLKRKARSDGDALEELLHSTRAGQSEGTLGEPSDELTLEELLEGPSAPIEPPLQLPLPTFDLSPIICADFVQWARSYDGRRFSLIHCDFPYGVGLFSSNGLRSGANRSQMGRDEGEAYEDSPELFARLLEVLCDSLPRLLAISGHIMFWLDARSTSIEQTKRVFAERAPHVSWTRFPLIWLKSDNAGIAASPQYEPRHIYETCLLGSVGDRPIIRIKSDAYACPTDKALHPSTKPESMLRHFMEMLVDEESSVFDPTCGSGAALRAAESLGAKRVLGLEIDPRMAELALRELNASRAKRKAAELMGF